MGFFTTINLAKQEVVVKYMHHFFSLPESSVAQLARNAGWKNSLKKEFYRFYCFDILF